MKYFQLNFIKPTLMRLFNVFFISVFAYILLNVIFTTSVVWNFYKPTVLIIGSVISITLLILINRWLLKCSEKGLKTITFINFFLLFLIQLFCFRFFMVEPSWDFGAVFNSAIESVHSSKGMVPYFYFMYPNNIPLYIFFMVVIKILSTIGVNDYLPALIMINIFRNFLYIGFYSTQVATYTIM